VKYILHLNFKDTGAEDETLFRITKASFDKIKAWQNAFSDVVIFGPSAAPVAQMMVELDTKEKLWVDFTQVRFMTVSINEHPSDIY
jgi:hypothetical protein